MHNKESRYQIYKIEILQHLADDKSDALAQYVLGHRFLKGEQGAEQNDTQALWYFFQSSSQGNRIATREVFKLCKKISEQDPTKLRDIADDFGIYPHHAVGPLFGPAHMSLYSPSSLNL